MIVDATCSTVEGLPNSDVMSMAGGASAVVFRVGGVCRGAPMAGCQARYLGPDEIFNGVSMMLTDRDLRNRPGKIGVSLMQEQLSLERQTQGFLNPYQEIGEA